MVSAGDTVCEKGEAGMPMPWSMVMTVAPCIFQVSVEVPPDEMVFGVAVNELITGGAVPSEILFAVRMADAVFEPKLLIAVMV